jgi:hypothetical protein
MFNHTIDNISNWNGQLYRELKGKLNPRNLSITVIISLFTQGFIYLIYRSSLPAVPDVINRYCIGQVPQHLYDTYYRETNFCIKNALGTININWPLWYLDIFVCLGILAIFLLTIAGSYLLIGDLSKEEDRGTLNFIRLSPQTAKDFFIGKILGVPILIYLVILLGLPFHLFAGLKAQIPLILIISFYAVLMASCVFFYSSSLLYSLIFTELVGFKIWFGSGILLLGIYLLCIVTMSSNSLAQNSLDWSVMFYPGTVLSYLIHSTNLGDETVKYIKYSMFDNLSWFGFNIWRNPVSGIGFILVNYLVGIYWVGIGLSRRFYNPDARILTKKQSYFLTTIMTLMLLGFSLQSNNYSQNFFGSLSLLFGLNFVICLGLMVILTPQRQTLIDWSRYRHQTSAKRRNLSTQLIWNDDAPSSLTIVINWLIISIICLPAILLITEDKYRFALLLGLILQLSLLILLTTVTQILLMLKTKKRNLFALSSLTVMVFLPLLTAMIFRIEPNENPLVWLFSFLPMISLEYLPFNSLLFSFFSQIGAIAFLNFYLTKKIQQLGESTTKALL